MMQSPPRPAAGPEAALTDAATMLAGPTADDRALGLDQTAVAPSASGGVFKPPPLATRTTVLPRVEGDGEAVQLALEERTRYEPVKLLGAGGMGEVVLVQDQDIARRVAVKRLLPGMTHPSVLARFVDEIRTVGRLEHPNIVPIHDVGVDDLGRYFFVMKYVEGETLETIIEKLSAGDKATHARYSFEQRIELFLGVLHALEYAHAQGVVHRDIKPANVMVGRYGEVVLMDWGIAKPLDEKRDPAAGAEAALAGEGDERGRMFATRLGSILGTPAYMSPEQARGENDRIDARSDLYSAAVLFHELVSLRHPIHDAQTLDELLDRVKTEEFGFFKLIALHHPDHAPPPAELVHFVQKGIAKDPALRFQSAGEMIERLQDIVAGKVPVQCHITFTKRATRELGRFVDARPHVAFFTLIGLAAVSVLVIVQAVRSLLA
jgi:serine/threonine-protein kinase